MVSTPAKPLAEPSTLLEEIAHSPSGLPMLLRLPDDVPLSDRLLEQISRLNKPWQFERTAEGELLIMAPSGIDSDEICAELGGQLRNWVRSGIGGVLTGSSGGYERGDGHTAAPDAAWTSPQRRASMTEDQRQQTYQPICPDFVIEVRSGSDTVASQRRKMEAWIAGGTRLGWLIVPESETVSIYRPGEAIQTVNRPETLSAEPVCPGLTISFEYVWDLDSARDEGRASE